MYNSRNLGHNTFGSIIYASRFQRKADSHQIDDYDNGNRKYLIQIVSRIYVCRSLSERSSFITKHFRFPTNLHGDVCDLCESEWEILLEFRAKPSKLKARNIYGTGIVYIHMIGLQQVLGRYETKMYSDKGQNVFR